MERSNPNDRADEPSDDDAAGYPLAPLPRHERMWRHPSEMGQQAWVVSEPPIALGRGLLVTTSAIGCAIGLAILWMLFPVGGAAPAADPQATGSTNVLPPSRSPLVGSASTTVAPTASGLVTSSTALAPIATAPPSPTLPAEDVPGNTVMLHAAEPVENAAIAVLVGESSLMITTANAVGDDTELSVVLASGDTGMATVVSISDSLAYLRPADPPAPEDLLTVGFATSAAAVPGDVLHVLSAEPISFTFDGDHQLGDVLPAGVVEGTPVVNAAGALVALCTHDQQGVVFVPVPAPVATETTAPSDSLASGSSSPTTTTSVPTDTQPAGPGSGTSVPAIQGKAWLGLRLASASDGLPGVAVHTVWAGSPAAAAGFMVGQRLIAIDGKAVQTPNDVAAILQQHRPGDMIVVTVLPANSAATTTTSASSPTTAPVTSAAPSTAASSTSAAPTSAAPATTRPATTTPSAGTAPAGSVTTTVAAGTTVATGAGSMPSTTAPTTAPAAAPTTAPPTVLQISVVLGEREPNV